MSICAAFLHSRGPGHATHEDLRLAGLRKQRRGLRAAAAGPARFALLKSGLLSKVASALSKHVE